MDILYLLIPLSVVAMLGVLGIFAWALHAGQFDDLERECALALFDPEQGSIGTSTEKSPACH